MPATWLPKMIAHQLNSQGLMYLLHYYNHISKFAGHVTDSIICHWLTFTFISLLFWVVFDLLQKLNGMCLKKTLWLLSLNFYTFHLFQSTKTLLSFIIIYSLRDACIISSSRLYSCVFCIYIKYCLKYFCSSELNIFLTFDFFKIQQLTCMEETAQVIIYTPRRN